ncbi:MAG: hypothetical protein ABIO95_03410 [Bdellovibrionota bacterium]
MQNFRCVRLVPLFLVSSFALANGSRPPRVDMPAHRSPDATAAVFYPDDKFTIKTVADLEKAVVKLPGSLMTQNSSGIWVWDLGGGILDGTNQSGDEGQSETQEQIARIKMPLIIRNGFIRHNKNALQFYAVDSGVEKITWLTVGEDAVATHDGAERFSVVDCEFLNNRDGDKSIQLNEAKDAIIRNNLIYSGITCIRVGDDHTTEISDNVEITHNRFVGCDTDVNASKITVLMRDNTLEGVRKERIISNGAIYR